MKPLTKKLCWLTIFSVAMGFMEAAVVVYLRKIYYPNGFSFPLIPIDSDIALTEILREAATIIMLLGIAILAGKNTSQKFAFFIYCFAIWDIFYYVFLKLLINWPESVFTWDILFLIPVPWTGPVIAPCIISVTMIILTLCLVYFHERGVDTKIKKKEWILLSSGSLIIILSFMWDYFKYIRCEADKILNYIPNEYNWWLFSLGELIIVYGIVTFIRRVKNSKVCKILDV